MISKYNELFSIWKKIIPNVNNKIILNVLIINLPCNGFGDIIFSIKFSSFLKEWYSNFNIKIITTEPDKFKMLGYDTEKLLFFNTKKKECRKLKFLKPSSPLEKFDLIFIAPVTTEYYPDIKDVKSLVPYSNKFNTFFISEYNDNIRKKIDFQTGIGKNRLGLFFTKKQNYLPYLNFSNYCVCYVSDNVSNVKNCVKNFCEMVSLKYKENDFSIILPSFVKEYFGMDIINIVRHHYKSVEIYTKNRIKKYNFNKTGKVIKLRYDIYPLSYKDMNSLIFYSNKDILITGDQSLTDVLSCCVDKNIFYQIAPWKEYFAKKLFKEMPNVWLKNKKTSCGTVKAINYKSNYKSFRKKWDFNTLAKPLFDRLITFTQLLKKEKSVQNYVKLVLKTRTIKSFFKKFTTLQ